MSQVEPPPVAGAADRNLGLRWSTLLLVALSLSIGWGVRGNWGHEFGAMIPGALAAMAAVLLSGRDDWYRRVGYFAFFGALGWSFGGSISYMMVIGYTHSGDVLFDFGREASAPSVLYGYASLFLIGFLWAAMGGAGTALPALTSREKLTEFFVPLSVLFGVWFVQGLVYEAADSGTLEEVQARYGESLGKALVDWLQWQNIHDTDWVAALTALISIGVLCLLRRRVCWASSLILHMAVGWFLGFAILTLAFGLRMTPPRGDSWSGCVGMTAAMFVWLFRHQMREVAWAALVVGFFGGLGFSGATFWKLFLIWTGKLEGAPAFWSEFILRTNTHSILEQSFGFISGIGVALALGYLSVRSARLSDTPAVRPWTDPYVVAFVLLVITWINIRKNTESMWLQDPGVFPSHVMYGLPVDTWFTWAYLLLALLLLVVMVAHRRGRHVPMIPASWLGRGQLLYLLFLWWIVWGNLARTTPFTEQRLVTEGVIHLNAVLCSLLVLLVPQPSDRTAQRAGPIWPRWLYRTFVTLLVATILIVLGEYVGTRAMFGQEHAGHSGWMYRFRPLPEAEASP